MTTIVTDGLSIAADGQSTSGSEITRTRSQKILVRHGRVYAFCGGTAIREALIAWHHAGADPATYPVVDDKFAATMLVLEAPMRGTYYATEVRRPDPVEFPFAMGTGQDFATGAVLAGASVQRAVEIASLRDIYTGGEITVVDIAAALKPAKRTPRAKASQDKVIKFRNKAA